MQQRALSPISPQLNQLKVDENLTVSTLKLLDEGCTLTIEGLGYRVIKGSN